MHTKSACHNNAALLRSEAVRCGVTEAAVQRDGEADRLAGLLVELVDHRRALGGVA